MILGGPALRPEPTSRTSLVGANMIFVFRSWMEMSDRWPVTVAASEMRIAECRMQNETRRVERRGMSFISVQYSVFSIQQLCKNRIVKRRRVLIIAVAVFVTAVLTV